MSDRERTEAGPVGERPRTYGEIVWRQVRKRPSALVSLGVIVALAMVALFAPFFGGDVPIRWVEKGEASWPIFRYMANLEYAAMLACLQVLLLTLTKRLLQRQAEATGASAWARAVGLHLAVWVAALALLETLREDNLPHPPYLARRAEAESAWFPLIAYPRQPGFDELSNKDMRPSWSHPLGIGRAGNDIFIGLIYGARTAMTIGFVTVGLSSLIGVALGALSGYFVGWIDLVMMRVAEIFMCIPRLILIILILTVIPPGVLPPLWTVVVVLGVTGWTGTYRYMRAELLRIRGEDYIMAARALGIPTWRLLWRHAVPNGLAPILVGATFGIAGAVFLEASLAFLGLVQTPSWGEMLNDGRQHIETWWVWVSAGAAIFVTVFVYNLLGEAIRDAIDPRLKV